MALSLYAHPFSSYCQKALIALYENDIPFEFRLLEPSHPDVLSDFAALWPIGRFPALTDGDRLVVEATIIIEHLHVCHRGPVALLPDDPEAAIRVRMLDRIFDNYVMTPMQKVVGDALRSQDERDPKGVADAQSMLGAAYAWLDGELAGRHWAAGADFSLADCAAGPSLFYADWVRPVPDAFENLRRYRERLLARPSFKRAIDEARPYRHYFPLGAPDRD